MVYRDLFWLSGVFGLIHGAAVASALIDLGLPATGRVWALLAFNIGVEAAQTESPRAGHFPAYALRNTRFYRFGVLTPGSAVVAVIGLVLVRRTGFRRLFSACRYLDHDNRTLAAVKGALSAGNGERRLCPRAWELVSAAQGVQP